MRISSVVFSLPAIVVLFLLSVPIDGQNRVYKWSDELCDFSGTYNAAKHTRKQIEDTEILFQRGSFNLGTMATAFTPSDIAKLNLADLEKEYREKSAAITALDIVPVQYWQELRKAKLAEMRQVYELSRVSILAYSNANALNDLAGLDSCKVKYAAPLIAGGERLFNVWKEVNEESRKKNGDPDRLRSKFEQQNASADRMKYAFVEVMTFGWWNCANQSIKYVTEDGTQAKEFKKLFVRVRRLRCSEP